ncbi:hypothetical protein HANVADRAFT_52170 [Hanseniaspora valbyensis NRRL Y-1626]|uniref:t-SNARE coiled-coil homology domain-containing protein n=1 Tax=Hanseniaspora valbyensis NRRL Y-1626 TaxID=766949 RepID=A0A1B7TGG5_9ASCO|nr:hypothetical protein HANVADRAFT_52170 [Hanseniaspora valbyensis NRRL Y-1626]
MNSLWNTYNSEFQIVLKRCRQFLEGQQETITRETLNIVESLKLDLENLIKNLELESDNDQQQRNTIREYKAILRTEINTKLQEEWEYLKKRELLSSNNYKPYSDLENGLDLNEEDNQMSSLLNNNQILNETGNRLSNINQIVNDTSMVGNDILMNLKQQRETLENSRQVLFNSNSYIDSSLTTLKSMSRRLVANKYISYCIIIVLILLILLVLYHKL